jgi:hypothetical protein
LVVSFDNWLHEFLGGSILSLCCLKDCLCFVNTALSITF